MLVIRKKGNKNFIHETSNYENYGANDITIIFEGNNVKLRSFSGRIIFHKNGYAFSDVRVFDDSVSGSEEFFSSITELAQRLIDLGYPFQGGITGVNINSINGGTP